MAQSQSNCCKADPVSLSNWGREKKDRFQTRWFWRECRQVLKEKEKRGPSISLADQINIVNTF